MTRTSYMYIPKLLYDDAYKGGPKLNCVNRTTSIQINTRTIQSWAFCQKKQSKQSYNVCAKTHVMLWAIRTESRTYVRVQNQPRRPLLARFLFTTNNNADWPQWKTVWDRRAVPCQTSNNELPATTHGTSPAMPAADELEKPSLEVTPTTSLWCYSFTVSDSGLLFRPRCRNWFSQFHCHFQPKKEHFPPMTLNSDRWPWPTYLT